MTDGTVATRLVLPDGTDLAFQDYFVRRRHSVAVSGVHFDGDGAVPAPGVLAAIDAGDDGGRRAVQPARVDRAAAVAAGDRGAR